MGSSNNESFGNIQEIINNNYNNKDDLQYNCNNSANRVIPSGKLPGSTIILSPSERQGLLKKFVENGP
jgi:hypothetical protein